jgi:hypothetical protein
MARISSGMRISRLKILNMMLVMWLHANGDTYQAGIVSKLALLLIEV